MSHHASHAVHESSSSSSNGSKPTTDSKLKHQSAIAIPQEAIAKRAYEKYTARGCVHGFDQQDWSEASRELIVEALAH